MNIIIPALTDNRLSDIGLLPATLSKEQADQLFIFFKQHPLFNWKASNNGCEGRADAVTVLFDSWGIPNGKAWVFGGRYLKKHVGELIQNWNYHVAPVIAVEEQGQIIHYVIDPSMAGSLITVDVWAALATKIAHGYYFMRQSKWYIFPSKKIVTEKWNLRNRQNRKWMIQCLAGINSMTATGRARLIFNKRQINEKELSFEKIKKEIPVLT